MRNVIVIVIVIVIAFIICGLIIPADLHNKVYEKDYFARVGISGTSYENILIQKGEPQKKERNDDFFYAYYDGITFVFDGKKIYIYQGLF